MDFGRIVQMVINMLIRKAVSGGLNAAMRQVGKKGGRASDDADQDQTARIAARRAKDAMKINRKF
ncbi:MAG: hypothetical protein ACRC14_19890 [Paracoccaceae bacterium]